MKFVPLSDHSTEGLPGLAMNLSIPQRGDQVRVDGRPNEYAGQRQLSLIEAVTIQGQAAYPIASQLSVDQASAEFEEREATFACLRDLVVTTIESDPDQERRGGFRVSSQVGTAEFFIGESLYASEVAMRKK